MLCVGVLRKTSGSGGASISSQEPAPRYGSFLFLNRPVISVEMNGGSSSLQISLIN